MDPFIGTTSVVFGVIMFVFTISFFVIWYRKRDLLRPYTSYGYNAGFILMGLELLAVIFLVIGGRPPLLLMVIIIDVVVFFRVAAFTVVGIYYCTLMRIDSFPFAIYRVPIPRAFLPPEDKELSSVVETGFNEPETTEETFHIVLKTAGMGEMIMVSSTVALVGMLYSVLLFWLTEPKISDLAREAFGGGLPGDTWLGILLTIVVVLSFAFAEEIIFRLGIQNFLAKQFGWHGQHYWWAIILTTILWTMSHVGVMDPNWVKMVQIFPLGIALGWLFKTYGTESCIIAHGVFNLIVIIPSSYLIL